MSLLLKNGTFIDWQTLEFKLCHVIVENGSEGKISFLVNDSEIDESIYSDVIDCTDKYITKSFVVGHHHIYSALSRGMPAPPKSPNNFHEKLKYIWWRLDKVLDKEMIRASALATGIAAAKDGNTFIIDHHSSPNNIYGSLDLIAETLEEIGLQHLLCYEISDRDGADKVEEGLQETKDYLTKRQGLVGLHASFTVGQKTLEKAVDLMEYFNAGIHIHSAEDLVDQEITQDKFKQRVIHRLEDAGVLESGKSILAHCIHLDEKEREILQKSNAWIVQNMESNLNNNVGVFNGQGFDRKMLGTDGMHSDMIRSAQYSFFAAHKNDKQDFLTPYIKMRNNHSYLSQNSFKGDGENNLVIINYDGPTEMNQNNFLGHFLYGFHGGHIEHVISNGKAIVKNHKLLNIDEEEVLAYTKLQAKRLWKKLS